MTSEEFNNALIERHGIKIYEKLKNSKVAIAGLGGLGSNVAIALALPFSSKIKREIMQTGRFVNIRPLFLNNEVLV